MKMFRAPTHKKKQEDVNTITHKAQKIDPQLDIVNRHEILPWIDAAASELGTGATHADAVARAATDKSLGRPPAVQNTRSNCYCHMSYVVDSSNPQVEYLLFLPVRGEVNLLPVKRGPGWRGILNGRAIPLAFGHAALRYTIPNDDADAAWDHWESLSPGPEKEQAHRDAMALTEQRVLNIIQSDECLGEMYACPEDYILGYGGDQG